VRIEFIKKAPTFLSISGITTGWGYLPSGLWAKRFATLLGRPYLLKDDALVRSMKPGLEGAVYGVSVDRSGAIYDAENGCDLVQMIAVKNEPDTHTTSLIQQFKDNGISKYNWFSEQDVSGYAPGVLLVDQPKGEVSLRYGGMQPSDFLRMFEDAQRENPNAVIYILRDLEQFYCGKKSSFPSQVLNHPRVKILPAKLSPKQCFQFCHTVYTGTSLIGMEALIHRKKVISYGWNFYAGWGLTEDRCHFERRLHRPKKVSLEILFETAYVDYCQYYDPDTGRPCSIAEIMDHITYQKQSWQSFEGEYALLAPGPWREKLFRLYLKGGKHQATYYQDADEWVNAKDSIKLAWGVQQTARTQNYCRVEDGFLRSKGLGVGFNLPLSLIFDKVGIYFDATRPSYLEEILHSLELTEEMKAQAEQLAQLIRQHNLTKYNFARKPVKRPDAAKGRPVILVPGQVEGDASIKQSSPKVKSNLALLQLVRSRRPDAYICFKPHPDLVARLRKGIPIAEEMKLACDEIITEGDVISWVKVVDEVHTMTSTVGFEALVHRKKVVTYGMPFYAGWGLTQDELTCERRTRSITLDQLVYGALIEYPTYLNPNTGEYITPLKAAQLLSSDDYETAPPERLWRVALIFKKWWNQWFGR